MVARRPVFVDHSFTTLITASLAFPNTLIATRLLFRMLSSKTVTKYALPPAERVPIGPATSVWMSCRGLVVRDLEAEKGSRVIRPLMHGSHAVARSVFKSAVEISIPTSASASPTSLCARWASRRCQVSTDTVGVAVATNAAPRSAAGLSV